MISNSKSLGAIFLLFLIFFASSRYFQIIIFDRDLSNTFFHRLNEKRNVCDPDPASILGHYKKTNKRVLFIMLDSYPQESLYKKLVGYESKLHNFLRENSSEYIETSTPVPYTYKSLPYLLGKVNINEKCRFPFLSGYLKPNLILGSRWMATSESICKFQIKEENFFLRINQFIKSKRAIEQKSKWGINSDECYLSSKDSINRIKTKMEDERSNKRNISFIAESKFHDVISPKLNNKPSDLKLIPLYDEVYLLNLKRILNIIFKHNLVDEIIVMNDHGPRTEIFGELVKDEKVSRINLNKVKKKLELNSFFDKDFYGVFIAKFDLNTNKNKSLNKYSNNNFLKKFIPNNKKRYFVDLKGDPILIK